jgi:anti-sigma regulatory factor (Ser/Thr protein kinase)
MKQSFRYKAHIQAIPSIRKDLDELKVKWKLPPSEMRQILVIIEELFSHIIRLASPGGDEHMVGIDMSFDGTWIEIGMKDDGHAFNPLDYDPEHVPDPLHHDEGGMGLALVKAFADHLEYSRVDPYNVVEIKKQIKSNSE